MAVEATIEDKVRETRLRWFGVWTCTDGALVRAGNLAVGTSGWG